MKAVDILSKDAHFYYYLPLNHNAKVKLQKLQSLIAPDLEQVNQVILQLTGSRADLIPQLSNHLIASGGKRLRPILTLLSARLCGYTGSSHINLAASVEFIHTATLLHDDVVDESALRRNLPTANNVWGNKASILVGDFLFSQAFKLMVQEKSLRSLEILSHASAVISEGEVLQLMAANDITASEETYLQIIRAKTAELFAAACQIGAVIADRTQEEEQALRSYGMNLGIAFQMVDDALDYSATQEELGKTIGDDFREGKATLPIILAYARGTTKEKTFWERTIKECSQQAGDLEQAIVLINHYDAGIHTLNEAKRYASLGNDALTVFPESEEKSVLRDILEFSVERAY